MAKRSNLSFEANTGEISVNISHVEARRLIREYGLVRSDKAEGTNDEAGTWSKDHGRYFVTIAS